MSDLPVDVTVTQPQYTVTVTERAPGVTVQQQPTGITVATPLVAAGVTVSVEGAGGLNISSPVTTAVIQTATQGPAGPPGPQGVQGIQGPPGANGGIYVYTQSTPAAVWTINHNLGNYLPVVVVDSSGDEVEGTVSYLDVNTVQVTFSAPFSGTAVVN